MLAVSFYFIYCSFTKNKGKNKSTETPYNLHMRTLHIVTKDGSVSNFNIHFLCLSIQSDRGVTLKELCAVKKGRTCH